MIRIVVVDDEFLVIEGIRILLEDLNIESELVGYANDGSSALEILEKNHPDVLFTDIRMPGLSGLELIKKCRDLYPEMLSVVISGYQEFVYAQKAIEMEVIGYIDKPITRQKLERSLRKAEDLIYKRMLQKTENPVILQEFDNFIRTCCDGNCEGMKHSYMILKEQMHQEKMRLDEYKRFMFMLITSLVGNYYDLAARTLNETHFPSYRNMSILNSYEEVDQYADTIMESIVRKMQMEQSGVVHDAIKHVLEYIENHFQEDLSLQKLADLAEMNAVYLGTLFKQETGTSYVKYLTELRLEKAKKLLLQGYRVAEVSEMVGYPNYRYFSDLFKKKEGVTPNEYKGSVRRKS